jgi:hypothetical protein
MARIMFCELINGEEPNATMDYGISTFIGENDLPVFIYDVGNLRVLMEDGRVMQTTPCIGYAWDLQEFMELEEDPRIAWLEENYPAEMKKARKQVKKGKGK